MEAFHLEDHEQIMGTASYVSPECPAPFAAQFAEIEMDIDTGQVTIIKLVMAVDCGVAINPVTASGQVEGGMLQALGYAHCEEYAFDETGKMINDSLGPYKIYRADEMPDFEVFLVQTMEDSGPLEPKLSLRYRKMESPSYPKCNNQRNGRRYNEIPFLLSTRLAKDQRIRNLSHYGPASRQSHLLNRSINRNR